MWMMLMLVMMMTQMGILPLCISSTCRKFTTITINLHVWVFGFWLKAPSVLATSYRNRDLDGEYLHNVIYLRSSKKTPTFRWHASHPHVGSKRLHLNLQVWIFGLCLKPPSVLATSYKSGDVDGTYLNNVIRLRKEKKTLFFRLLLSETLIINWLQDAWHLSLSGTFRQGTKYWQYRP